MVEQSKVLKRLLHHRGQSNTSVVSESSGPCFLGDRDDGGPLKVGWHVACLQIGGVMEKQGSCWGGGGISSAPLFFKLTVELIQFIGQVQVIHGIRGCRFIVCILLESTPDSSSRVIGCDLSLGFLRILLFILSHRLAKLLYYMHGKPCQYFMTKYSNTITSILRLSQCQILCTITIAKMYSQ